MAKTAFACAALCLAGMGAMLGCAAAAPADPPGLSPFVGSWVGKRESVDIDTHGHGRFHYADMTACKSCSMADMPYADMDFALTSVSGDTATGSVTADTHDRTGKPVVMVLKPASADGAPQTISWTVGGLDEGLFCPASDGRWCGY